MHTWGGPNMESSFRFTEKGILFTCACGKSYWWHEQKRYVYPCPTCRSRLRVIIGDAADRLRKKVP
ncbi:MAG: hypothetical protein GWN58_22915 [Anaerolineae bacterium]|nr:hypothetical protein [Thermoplasmata archaeon]NIV32227.1 hypothetical protein [Anaerolineae bacterium]NIY03679.1 hypothetical protein [Thermoplasmata archaeon]